MENKKKIFVIVKQHCDLSWRRCFLRDFEYKGKNFISYGKLQSYYIIDNINLCEKYCDYRFEIESVAMLRQFLKSNPEYVNKVKELIQTGRIYIPFTGDNIVDSNMVFGEGIIRNFLLGYNYLKDNFDFVPKGADRHDAFGNCGQLPQILNGFGVDWVYNTSYSECEGNCFRGIDGSEVYHFTPKTVASYGGYYKYRPCPECNGFGGECAKCNGRGIDVEFSEKLREQISMDAENLPEDVPGFICVGGEEILPDEGIIAWVNDNKEKFDAEFKTYADYFPYFEAMKKNGHAEYHQGQELNPNNTGCYVTRIKTKQCQRENENRITGLETVAVLNFLKSGEYPEAELLNLWEKLMFTSFHDTVTGTVIDAAYTELMDCHMKIKVKVEELTKNLICKMTEPNDEVITVLNPYGVTVYNTVKVLINKDYDVCLKDEKGEKATILSYTRTARGIELEFLVCKIPPLSKKEYYIEKTEHSHRISYESIGEVKSNVAEAVLHNAVKICASESIATETKIENEFYIVKADNHGILSIYDKVLKKIVFLQSEYRVGELILEHDEGSPWATLSPDMRRIGLSPYTTLTEKRTGDGYESLVFEVIPSALMGYSVSGLRAKYRVELKKSIRNIEFFLDVDWNTENHRLRIAFPTVIKGEHYYDIPYGVIKRKPYEPDILNEDLSSNWASAAGDYPALRWSGIQSDEFSVALFNCGTPSYQINIDKKMSENIYLSVLRSPSVATYLNEPGEYSMTDYDGMRDSGHHSFRYALSSYEESFCANTVVRDGISYNAILPVSYGRMSIEELPQIISDHVYIAAMKKSRDGILIRVVEQHGIESTFILKIPDRFIRICLADMKEEIAAEIPMENNMAEIRINPYEIKTIIFRKEVGDE